MQLISMCVCIYIYLSLSLCICYISISLHSLHGPLPFFSPISGHCCLPAILQPCHVFCASSLAASGQGPEAAMACQQRADSFLPFCSSSRVLVMRCGQVISPNHAKTIQTLKYPTVLLQYLTLDSIWFNQQTWGWNFQLLGLFWLWLKTLAPCSPIENHWFIPQSTGNMGKYGFKVQTKSIKNHSNFDGKTGNTTLLVQKPLRFRLLKSKCYKTTYVIQYYVIHCDTTKVKSPFSSICFLFRSFSCFLNLLPMLSVALGASPELRLATCQDISSAAWGWPPAAPAPHLRPDLMRSMEQVWLAVPSAKHS